MDTTIHILWWHWYVWCLFHVDFYMTLLSFNEIQKYSTPQVLLTLHEWTHQFRSSVLNQPQNRMEFNAVILSFLLLGSLLTFRYAHLHFISLRFKGGCKICAWGYPSSTFLSGGQQLSFGSQKDVFKHDNFESVPDGWTLTNAAIVSVSSQAPKQTTPPPTTKAPGKIHFVQFIR